MDSLVRFYGANRGRRTPSDRGSGVLAPLCGEYGGATPNSCFFSMGRATGGDLGAPVESIEQFQETVVWYRVLSDIEAPKQRQSSGKIPFRSAENRGSMRWKRSMGIRANPAYRDRLRPIATDCDRLRPIPKRSRQNISRVSARSDRVPTFRCRPTVGDGLNQADWPRRRRLSVRITLS